MKCPECLVLRQKSKVKPLPVCVNQDLKADRFYDENRRRHFHDPNVRKQYFSCTRGHQWFELRVSECPVCKWPNNEEKNGPEPGGDRDTISSTAPAVP